MYGYIRVTIVEIDSNYVILDNNGIGYIIYVPNPYSYQLNKIYTKDLEDFKITIGGSTIYKVYPIIAKRIVFTTNDIVEECKLHINSVNKVLNKLVEQGYLIKEKKKGTTRVTFTYKNMYDIFEVFSDYEFTDSIKKNISAKIYINSKVGLIYGSAGTGKTEMIKIISKIFDGKRIAFLAKTNAALNNIKIRVGKESMDNYEFYTVDKFIDDSIRDSYDLVVVDECSMVENDIMLQMLKKNNYGK